MVLSKMGIASCGAYPSSLRKRRSVTISRSFGRGNVLSLSGRDGNDCLQVRTPHYRCTIHEDGVARHGFAITGGRSPTSIGVEADDRRIGLAVILARDLRKPFDAQTCFVSEYRTICIVLYGVHDFRATVVRFKGSASQGANTPLEV
jgi:hypothetical protein